VLPDAALTVRGRLPAQVTSYETGAGNCAAATVYWCDEFVTTMVHDPTQQHATLARKSLNSREKGSFE
jgi:hypothetical protein